MQDAILWVLKDLPTKIYDPSKEPSYLFPLLIKPKLLGKNIYFTVKGTSVARVGFPHSFKLNLDG